VTFSWTPQLGSWNLFVVADPDGAVLEASETNNIASCAATVLQAPSVSLDSGSDTGVVGDGWTSIIAPRFNGTTTAGTTVAIFVDSQQSPVAQAPVTGTTFTVTMPPLANGQHTIWAQAYDSNGNPSPMSEPLNLLIDASAPPTLEAAQLDPASDSGVLGDGITTVARPEIVGTAKPMAAVRIYDGTTALGDTIAAVDGDYSFTPAAALSGGVHLITAVQIDDVGNSSTPSPAMSLTISSVVAGTHIFYNHSAWDGNNQAANVADDAAIATDKAALLPGGTASFANYTSYDKGINGIMVDIANLAGTPTAADFVFKTGNSSDPSTWTLAPAPLSITVRWGAGVNGSDRVTLIWADNNLDGQADPNEAVAKKWLQVTVLSDGNGGQTGLASDDVFYFGNAVGESGDGSGAPSYAYVNATDKLAARNNPRTFLNPAPIDFAYDFNRDKKVNATDELIASNNGTTFLTALKMISVPAVGGGTQSMAMLSLAAEPSVTGSATTIQAAAPAPAVLQADIVAAPVISPSLVSPVMITSAQIYGPVLPTMPAITAPTAGREPRPLPRLILPSITSVISLTADNNMHPVWSWAPAKFQWFHGLGQGLDDEMFDLMASPWLQPM
jgi:hypothetical protein